MTEQLEQMLAEILRAADPVAELDARAAKDPELAVLAAHVSRDGLRIAALLVARLRFERLVRGSGDADRESTEHPREFAEAFRRYHAEVPPTAFLASDEAAAWEAWRTRR